MIRLPVISIAVLALCVGTYAQDWQAADDALVDHVRQKRTDDALTLSRQMLDIYRRDDQVLRVHTLRAQAFDEAGRFADMVAEARSLDRTPLAENRPLLAKVLAEYAGKLHRRKRGEEAVEVHRLILSWCPKELERCAWARVGIGDCYAWYVKDAASKSAAEYQAALLDYPDQVQPATTALVRLKDMTWGLKDYRTCLDACRQALGKYRGHFDAPNIERFAIRVAECHAALEEWDAALAAYTEAERKDVTREDVKCDLAWRRALILRDLKRTPEAIVEFQRVIAAYRPSNPSRSGDALKKIFETYMAEERYDEALKYGRIALALDNNWAIPRVVECLQKRDKDETRLVEFLNRNIDGPVDKDGNSHPDVLAAVGWPDYPPEIDRAFDASLAAFGDDWRDLWNRGRLLLHRGRPREAAPLLYRALIDCPLPPDVNKVRRDLIEGVYHELHGTLVGSERWGSFLSQGPDGEALDAEIAAFSRRERPKRDTSPTLNEAVASLGAYITESYRPGVQVPAETRRRRTMMSAYFRIAVERGREDDFSATCRKVLADPGLSQLYDPAADLLGRMCRVRDGHMGGEFSELDRLADPKSGAGITPQAAGVVRRHADRLNPVRKWPTSFQPQLYRKHLPKKK